MIAGSKRCRNNVGRMDIKIVALVDGFWFSIVVAGEPDAEWEPEADLLHESRTRSGERLTGEPDEPMARLSAPYLPSGVGEPEILSRITSLC